MAQEIKHDGHRDRMRERILKSGLASLQDHEILEYLLFAFIPRKNTNDIAHTLISKFGTFAGVLNADVTALLEVDGMTKNAAVFLASLPDVFRVYLKNVDDQKLNLSGRGVIRKYLGSELYGRQVEQVVAVALDAKDQFIAQESIAYGDGASVTVSVRDIVNFAIKHKAVNVVIAHNHPSGTVAPSQADIDLTADAYATLEAIGVTLEDHYIFSGSDYFSFEESGRLAKIVDVKRNINKTFKEGIIIYE